MIPLSDYDKIFSRPGRPKTGDDGFELSEADEAALDKAWAKLAEQDGVEQFPTHFTEEEIRREAS